MNKDQKSRPYQNFEEAQHLIGRVVMHKGALSPSCKLVTEVHSRGAVIGQTFFTFAEIHTHFYIPDGELQITLGKIV